MFRYCLLFFLSASLACQGQTNYRMTQLARWDNDSLRNQAGQQYNEVQGWYDAAKQKEYALFCSIDSIYFIDVTNPAIPVLCDVEAGAFPSCRNRDVATYQHYAYVVAGQGNSSLQIFDMQYLPDSVHKVYDQDSLCVRSHTLCIDTSSARLYLCNTERKHPVSGQMISYAASVISLANPLAPVWLTDLVPPPLSFTIVHNAAVWRDTLFCSTGNTGLYIFDYRSLASPVLIKALVDYPEKGFNHSPAYDAAHRLMSFTDETGGMGVKLAEAKNFSNLSITDIFRSSTPAVAHRSHFTYPWLWVSYYHDGVYAFDISNPANVTATAWFDTYDNNGIYSGLSGCWGVYPYLPSGTILASDMLNGLFILKPDTSVGIKHLNLSTLNVYPNPFTDFIHVNTDKPARVTLTDHYGRVVYQSKEQLKPDTEIVTAHLAPGLYFLILENENGRQTRKLVKP